MRRGTRECAKPQGYQKECYYSETQDSPRTHAACSQSVSLPGVPQLQPSSQPEARGGCHAIHIRGPRRSKPSFQSYC